MYGSNCVEVLSIALEKAVALDQGKANKRLQENYESVTSTFRSKDKAKGPAQSTGMSVSGGVKTLLWELLEEMRGMNATMARQGELVTSELTRIWEALEMEGALNGNSVKHWPPNP